MTNIKNQTLIVFDATNLLYRTFYAYKDADDQTSAGLAHVKALFTLNKYFKKFKADHVVMAFDRSNWRKEYTKSDSCISGKIYKGTRRQDQTPAEQVKFQLFCEHINEFEEIMRERTGVICLGEDLLEADDLIAGVVEQYGQDNEIYIISSDKDLMQLLIAPNIHLVDPQSDEERNLDKHYNDPDWFMFLKCMRGDRGDNVGSAYPKIRETKLRKAYEGDAYEMTQIMEHVWIDNTGQEMKVKDLYKENVLLMDLFAQPEEIRERIHQTVKQGFDNPGSFSFFHFLKFCGKYKLQRVKDDIQQFVAMLS